MDVQLCNVVRPYRNWWTTTVTCRTSIEKLVDVLGCHVVRPYNKCSTSIQKLMNVRRCYAVRPYSNWWTSTVTRCTSLMKLVDIRGRMLYAHIEAGGGPPLSFFYVHIETGGRPQSHVRRSYRS